LDLSRANHRSAGTSSRRVVGDSYIGLIWRSEQLWRHYYRKVGIATGIWRQSIREARRVIRSKQSTTIR